MRSFILFVVLSSIVVLSAPLAAKDIPGSKDHPVVKRYKGSSIIGYNYRKFDEYKLITAKISKAVRYGGKIDKTNSIALEGTVTLIAYKNPKGRSTLEVFKNYEDSLKKAGFEILFKCANRECGGRAFNHTMKVSKHLAFAEKYSNQRYLAGRIKNKQGEVYVSLYVVGDGSPGRPTYTQLNVVEVAKMEKNMVTVDADAMFKAISSKGRIALYGIYFDYDKATIKKESTPALEQIAKLLQTQPALKLVVVGHTDNKGSLKYNMDLSHRRARAVADTLVRKYGIHADRLKSWGVGFLAPVASNRTEKGRALNRRVELVEQ